MDTIDTLDALHALYDTPTASSLNKVARGLTPLYRRWIGASRFVVLTTVGPDGTDGSPRGDLEPVVQIADDSTLLLPDWRGNNRLDSLRNIVVDGRISLMFMVPGQTNVVRVNGTAVLTADAEVTGRFERKRINPKIVIVVTIRELYFQCAKALMRSELWSGPKNIDLPSAGDFIREFTEGFDAKAYDDGYAEYAKPRMW
ncbi:MAG: MSMEG_1061 family FMN-dependent PPOX-type flavoprotein [Pseudomonadota bacterium]